MISQTKGDATYLTWIYVHDGYLCELFVEDGIAVNPDMGSQIVRMDELQLRQVSEDALQIVLIRKGDSDSPEGQEEQRGSRQIYLRSGGVGQ